MPKYPHDRYLTDKKKIPLELHLYLKNVPSDDMPLNKNYCIIADPDKQAHLDASIAATL